MRQERWETKTHDLRSLPSALEKKEEILHRLRRGMPAIFLDYDGTLTPIVEDPDKALLSHENSDAIRQLCENWAVVIISGRDMADVQKMVGIAGLVYSGSHGFEVAGPGMHWDETRWEHFLPELERAEAELRKSLKAIKGARVERKRFALAVHYRVVADTDVPLLERRFDRVAISHPELGKSTGKKVLELRPNIEWDKGMAVLALLEALFAETNKAVPLYIGDDTTDEDVFDALRDCGIAIAVGEEDRQTSAHYVLKDTEEVTAFLKELATLT